MNQPRLFRHSATLRTIPTCPLCTGGNAEFWSLTEGGVPRFEGWCPACTNMRISHSAVDIIKKRDKAHLLSAYLRDFSEGIWADKDYIVDVDVEELADSIPTTPLAEQFDRLLVVLCERTPRFGSPSRFSHETDWPMVRARDSGEVLAMLKDLKDSGYLSPDPPNSLPIPPAPTRKGFERLAQLRDEGPLSQQAFVAMAFAPQFGVAWDSIIKPGIIAAGYSPFRVDKKEHADKIDDLIMAEIRRSKFLVADFSGQRGGVYFEAGFALGLGRPVIWMCREDEKDLLHFDTRQYNHILYTDHNSAKDNLRNRIVAMLGEGINKTDQ